MKKLISSLVFSLTLCLAANLGFSQQDGGAGGAGDGFGGGGGAPGSGRDPGQGGRIGGAEDIVDNRAATATGENNRTLEAPQQNQANNMNFLNALFGGNLGNQNVNQNTPLRGRGIRAPLRLGFKFDGMPLDTGLSNLNARIVRIPRFKDSKITGVLQQKTLLLVGEVASLEEASLAVRIARFEPGVDQVKSLLTVAGQPAAGQ